MKTAVSQFVLKTLDVCKSGRFCADSLDRVMWAEGAEEETRC